jgi:MoxR-like ATPase
VLAAFAGRSYVVPDDVTDLVLPALRHRVILSPEAEVSGETTDRALLALLKTIEVPRL